MTSPFTPKAWADLQAGGTAITAAELNRMEQGIVAATPNRLVNGNGGQTVANWDDATLTGWYSGNNTTTNSPVSGEYYVGEVFTYDPNWVTQILYPLTGSLVWRRDRDATIWGPWRLMSSHAPDRPGGYQPDGTRRAAFMFGCGGEGSQTGFNAGHARIPFRIPVGTTRWRVVFQNSTPAGVSTGAPTVNVNGVWLGEDFRNLDTGDPISWWAGTPVQAVPAFTLSGGTLYRSAWVTASDLQLVAGRTHMIAYGWTKTSGTIYTGSGGSWTTTAAADVTAAQPAATYQPWVPFHVAIEYEFAGNQRVLVAVGDSITEGAKHVWNMWSWHQMLSMRLGIPVCLSAQFGSFAGTISPGWNASATTEPRWTRIQTGGLNIDAGIVYLGTNETAWGGTLQQTQQGLHGTMSKMRTIWGLRDVYFCTLHPRNLATTDAGEILRLQINAWLRSGQPTANGVFDLARAVETTLNGPTLATIYEGSGADRTHPNPAGQTRFADTMMIGDG